MSTDSILVAQDLRYTLPGATAPVLDGVSLTLARGELVDVTGPSGCGKTTLLRALARLLPAATGNLLLDGVSAADILPRDWRTRVALLPQIAALSEGSVRDNLLMPWTLKVRAEEPRPADDHLAEALAGVGLADITLDRDATRLSVGQAARVSLLRVVLTRPEVLLLDEPDANLDDDSASQVAALTAGFVASGGAALRVRHLRRDGAGTRRIRVEAGEITEVTPA